MSKEKVYLGNEVYAATLRGDLVLTVENKFRVKHIIVLKPQTLAALLKYLGVERVGKKEE